MLIAWMARQQTKIARATSARQMLPQVSPSTSFVIDVRPKPVASLSTAIVPKPISRKPMMPAVEQRADQRPGRRAPRIGRLLGE